MLFKSIIITIIVLLLTSCSVLNEERRGLAETVKSENESFINICETDTDALREKDSFYVSDQDENDKIGVNNCFTVNYDGNVFFCDSDGIYAINDDQKELFYSAEMLYPRLFCYYDRLYFFAKDQKIHSIDLYDKEESVLAEGCLWCWFYDKYVITFHSDGDEQYKLVAYEINIEEGTIIEAKMYDIGTVLGDETIQSMMHMSEDITYSVGDSIIEQKILIPNEMEDDNNRYYYKIYASGNVELKDQQGIVYYEQQTGALLLDDLNPFWTSLSTKEGVFFSDISENGIGTFPVFYGQNESGDIRIIENNKELKLFEIVNYADEWLYYTAINYNSEKPYGCYRVNVNTQENQLLYESEYESMILQECVADLQEGKLFYRDYINDRIKWINID